eukprot:gene3717-4637_t
MSPLPRNPNTRAVTPAPNPTDIRITFLGTGSAAPSRHRGNSSILIRSSPLPSGPASDTSHIFIMLDAGEGVASQLFQSVSGDEDRLRALYRDLSLVWISHHHADHHCGLPLLLEARHRYQHDCPTGASWRRLSVVASADVCAYISYVADVSGLSEGVHVVEIQRMESNAIRGITDGHVLAWRNVPVVHCKNSYACVVDFSSSPRPVRVVYSGDCRPTEALAIAGSPCDLLIHEATFADDMAEDAVRKRHSCISEALMMGVKMNAKHVILTHFSQRYPPQAMATERRDKSPVATAFDFLQFSYPSQIICVPFVCEDVSAVMKA